MTHTEQLREPEHLTEDEIKEIALKLVGGSLFVATQAPPEMMTSIFLPVARDGLAGIAVDKIGNIVEDLSKAGHWAINGYPTFLSCQVIHVEDWITIVEKAEAARAAVLDAVEGQS